MSKRYIVLLSMIAVLLGVLVGCSRDPNVRKQKYLESGKRYEAKKEYQAAAIQFANALQVDHNFAPAHYELAKTYLQMGNYPQAYRELSLTVSIDPKNNDAQIDLGNLLLAGNKLDDAEEHATTVLQGDPNSANGHALEASIAAARKDNAKALVEIKKAIELNPKSPQLYVTAALLNARAGNKDVIESYFKQSVSVDPKFAQGYSLLGQLYAQTGRGPEAEAMFRKAVETDSKNVTYRFELASYLSRTGNGSGAEQVLKATKQDLKDDPSAYRLLAEYYAGTNQTDRALAEYRSLTKDYPKDLVTKQRYAGLLLTTGKKDEAAEVNNEILKKNPRNADSLVLKGEILTAQGRPKDAIEPLDAAVKANPESAAYHYALGHAAILAGDLNTGETNMREALKLNPRMLAAQEAVAEIATKKGSMIELAEIAQQIILSNPNSPTGYIFLAQADLGRNDKKAADVDMQKALALAPKDPLVCLAAGKLKGAERDYRQAESFFKQALESKPDFVDAVTGLAQVYTAENRPDAALVEVQNFADKNPQNVQAALMLAEMLVAKKDFNHAESTLKHVLDVDPRQSGGYVLLANVYEQENGTAKAGNLLKHWTEVVPDSTTAMLEYGVFLDTKQNDHAAAKEWYQKVLKLQPDTAVAANNLAYLMLQDGDDPDVALSLAQTARRLAPNAPSIADTLALAYYKKGIYGSAADLLETAMKSAPNDVNMHYHLGLTYDKMGRANDARNQLEQVRKLDPNYQPDEVQKLLAQYGKS